MSASRCFEPRYRPALPYLRGRASSPVTARSDDVVAPRRGGPREDSGADLFQRPATGLFGAVMPTAREMDCFAFVIVGVAVGPGSRSRSC